MTQQFKIGDRVKCIDGFEAYDDEFSPTDGEVYTLTHVDNDGVYVSFHEGAETGWWDASRFELAPFVAGERVKISDHPYYTLNGNRHYVDLYAGREGVIRGDEYVELVDGDGDYVVKCDDGESTSRISPACLTLVPEVEEEAAPEAFRVTGARNYFHYFEEGTTVYPVGITRRDGTRLYSTDPNFERDYAAHEGDVPVSQWLSEKDVEPIALEVEAPVFEKGDLVKVVSRATFYPSHHETPSYHDEFGTASERPKEGDLLRVTDVGEDQGVRNVAVEGQWLLGRDCIEKVEEGEVEDAPKVFRVIGKGFAYYDVGTIVYLVHDDGTDIKLYSIDPEYKGDADGSGTPPLAQYIPDDDLEPLEDDEEGDFDTPLTEDDLADWERELYAIFEDTGDAIEGFDMVQHPQHYMKHPSGLEVIEITRHHNFAIGSALKYIFRHEHKGKPVEDLRKAIKYLEFEIEDIEAGNREVAA